MKTFENLQAEVVKLGKQSKSISKKVDMLETYKGISTFDADLVISELNRLATFHERMSITQRQYAEENTTIYSSKYWAERADGHYQAAKEVRETISYLTRTQKQRNL